MQTLQLSWPVQSIERAVAALWPGLAAEVLTQVDSTNTLLLERARAGLVQPTLVVAERQTAGRGRMGANGCRQHLSRVCPVAIGMPGKPAIHDGSDDRR